MIKEGLWTAPARGSYRRLRSATRHDVENLPPPEGAAASDQGPLLPHIAE